MILQRKVKFASEFDALEVVTDELKSKLTPVSSRLKSIEKERAERRKVRKRTKVAQEASSSSRTAEESTDVEMAPASDVPGDLEEESVYRARELQELEGLADADLKNDYGCSMTGLYDLVGGCRCCLALGGELNVGQPSLRTREQMLMRVIISVS